MKITYEEFSKNNVCVTLKTKKDGEILYKWLLKHNYEHINSAKYRVRMVITNVYYGFCNGGCVTTKTYSIEGGFIVTDVYGLEGIKSKGILL
jgi:hypothetical protein